MKKNNQRLSNQEIKDRISMFPRIQEAYEIMIEEESDEEEKLLLTQELQKKINEVEILKLRLKEKEFISRKSIVNSSLKYLKSFRNFGKEYQDLSQERWALVEDIKDVLHRIKELEKNPSIDVNCTLTESKKDKHFDEKEANRIIDDLVKQYKIKVIKFSDASCGYAFSEKREIKIPTPTNIDRFAVCLHEVKHIIDYYPKMKEPTYLQEFNCDKYAYDWLIKLGMDTKEWKKRTFIHIMEYIVKAINKGLKKIDPKVVDFFSIIDMSKWYGRNIEWEFIKGKMVFYVYEKYTKEGFYDYKRVSRISKDKKLIIQQTIRVPKTLYRELEEERVTIDFNNEYFNK